MVGGHVDLANEVDSTLDGKEFTALAPLAFIMKLSCLINVDDKTMTVIGPLGDVHKYLATGILSKRRKVNHLILTPAWRAR